MTNAPQTLIPDPRDSRHYYFGNTTTRRVITALVRGVFRLFTTFETSGLNHLPKSGPVVLVANHLTNFDVFPMQFVLPRLIFFMGKAELFANPLLDPIFRRLGGFPVHRGKDDDWAVRHALRVLEHGQVLGIFPEGKRSYGHGLRAAKTGAARFALAGNAPIVPMGVSGTDEIVKRLPHRTNVVLRAGPPIYPEIGENPLELTDRMMFCLADLLPLRLRGVYSQRPEKF